MRIERGLPLRQILSIFPEDAVLKRWLRVG
jgi:hypothetical protein